MDQPGNTHNPEPSRRRRATSDTAQHLDLTTLSAYVDRKLGDVDHRAVEVHLATCAACRQEAEEIGATVDLLRGLPRYQPRRSFRLAPAIARRERGSVVWLGRYLSALPALRVATAAVALLFLGTIVADVLTTSNAPSGPDFAAEDVETTTGAGEDAAVAVPTATSAPTSAQDEDITPASDETDVMEAVGDAEQETAQDEDTAAGAGANDETFSESADSEPALREAPAPAPSPPTATVVPTETAVPTPVATPTQTPTPTPVPERSPSTFSDDFPWLLVEIVLGVMLILLAFAFFMLRRLRRRLGDIT